MPFQAVRDSRRPDPEPNVYPWHTVPARAAALAVCALALFGPLAGRPA